MLTQLPAWVCQSISILSFLACMDLSNFLQWTSFTFMIRRKWNSKVPQWIQKVLVTLHTSLASLLKAFHSDQPLTAMWIWELFHQDPGWWPMNFWDPVSKWLLVDEGTFPRVISFPCEGPRSCPPSKEEMCSMHDFTHKLSICNKQHPALLIEKTLLC